MRLFPVFALAAAFTLTGCHSAYIEATLSNRTAAPISVVELDYPSASFGTQNLAPGQDFHYRFKVLGSGPTTLTWTDAARKDHKGQGIALREDDEGVLAVTINPGQTSWDIHLTNRSDYQPHLLR